MTTAQLDGKKGPKKFRFFVILLNIIFGLLIYWLLGFLMDDISQQPGPSLSDIQKKYQNPTWVNEKKTYTKQLTTLSSTIDQQQQQQGILATSINSYRDTMNQLLDLQKASIQKGMVFSPESQKNLQNVTNLYLNYQKQFQELNNSITQANLNVQQLQNKIKELDEQLSKQNEAADKEFEAEWVKHNWAMAGLQLIVLIPLLLITVYLLKTYGKSVYRPMILAAGIAIFFKIAIVMHDYFPSNLFKYLLILALIYVIAQVLISKLRMISAPNPPWLEGQYREAYQKNQCPVCEFSIKPGISKFFSSEEKNYTPLSDHSYLDQVDNYTCPSCGKLLFEQCTQCSHLRYSLLGYCDFCGVKKEEDVGSF
jgi:hypothetical protein